MTTSEDLAKAITGIPPHDPLLQRQVLGAAVWRPGVVADLAEWLDSSDFYGDKHPTLWAACVDLHQQGREVNASSVAERVAAMTDGRIGRTDVIDLSAVEWYGWRDAAGQLVRLARRRQVLYVAHELLLGTQDEALDPSEAVDKAIAALTGIDMPNTDTVPPGLIDIDTLVDRPIEERPGWLVPGLMRPGWRAIFVGEEGGGKSVLGRQVAIMAAQGVHPFTIRPMPKIHTLLVDLENPEDVVADSARPIRDRLRDDPKVAYEAGRAWAWLRPGGIDLRSRTSRRQLEAVLSWCRPDLVWLGPLYKAFRKGKGESDEEVAADLLNVLDDLRTRYGFALLIEHHAPKKQHGFRDWVPFGSSLWLRWPELGLALKPDRNDNHHVTIERWRGDRAKSCWPDELRWGSVWPWEPSYVDDSWKEFA